MANTFQAPGHSTVSVYLMADRPQEVIDFVTGVLGGSVLMRLDREDGSLMHASLSIGDSVVMLGSAGDAFPGFPVWLHVYVPDVDATYRRALERGAESVQEPSEKGDGDRRGGIKDPAGNTWWIATHVGR
jgi:PhnB protein